MEKTKRYILSTRPLPEALLEEAAAQHIFIDCLSFIETKPVIDNAKAQQITQLFQKPITAIFTSMNAVNAVAALFQNPIPWTFYCIGETTAQQITQLFQKPISRTAANAAALADVIINDGVQEAYFFCGNIRRNELPDSLQQANITLHEIVVYETLQTPHATKIYDAILFYSPSAVHSFFSANKIDSAPKLFAIGKTTAEAVQHYTSNPIIIGTKTGKEDLVRQMLEHYNKQNVQ